MQPLQHGLEEILRTRGVALVLIRSLAHAYVHIKRVAPDLIILYLASRDDAAGCQLRSMLGLDSATSGVPIVAHITITADYLGEEPSDLADVTQLHAGGMN